MSPMNNRRMVPTQEPGILDFAPGAAAAYSLRNLSLSYAGPVVTVRRSTDNAEADFKASEIDDGTLAAWCSGGDGFVKTWHDQSGNGNGCSQGTAANQPQIVDSGTLITEGGKAAVQFDGVDDYMSASGSITGQSIFLVNKIISYTDNAVVLSGATDFTFNLQYRGSDNFRSGLNNGTIYRDGAFSVSYTGTAEFSFPIENQQVLISHIAESAETDSTGIIICRERSASTYQESIVQELIIYPTDQTAIRARIEGNLNRHFGVF